MLTSPAVLAVLLEDAITRDRTTARRAALLDILQHERYLTREHLIIRVEAKLGKGCFGESAWVDTFFRDMQVVKRALQAAGYKVRYRRSRKLPGYYLHDQPKISAQLSAILEGSIAEVNLTQISISRRLSSQKRFQQGCSITNLACQVVANRIRQRNPDLSIAAAHRMVFQEKTQP
jgi:hypothetical protein